jgi:hypothetical protein
MGSENRAWCPGCDSETSTLKTAFDEGDSCPYCGLGNDAWHEVTVIRRARDDDDLSQRYAEVRVENDRLERELATVTRKLSILKSAVRGLE